jgi:hypothetical protein
MFISSPILSLFKYHHIIVIETDALGWYIKGILFQKDDKGILRLYTYYSKKNSSTKYNYKIYNKEILAII